MESDPSASAPILDALRQRFPSLPVGSVASLPLLRPSSVTYLAIGPAAFRAALTARITEPLLVLFSSRQSYETALKETQRYPGMKISAIFAETSPDTQFELIGKIYQRRVTVGVMLSEFSAQQAPALQRAASRFGLDLLSHRLAPSDNVVRELSALSSASVILVIPDTAVLSSDNLRGILESTYRRGQAVIGYTPALVKAGTLGTAYATLEDVLDQLPQLLAEFEQGRVPEPRYPSFWRIAINESVARSLNLVVSDDVRALARRKGPQ